MKAAISAAGCYGPKGGERSNLFGGCICTCTWAMGEVLLYFIFSLSLYILNICLYMLNRINETMWVDNRRSNEYVYRSRRLNIYQPVDKTYMGTWERQKRRMDVDVPFLEIYIPFPFPFLLLWDYSY